MIASQSETNQGGILMKYTKEMLNKCVSDNKLDTAEKTPIMCKCDGEVIFVAYYEDVFNSYKHNRKITTEAIKLLIQMARTSKRMGW